MLVLTLLYVDETLVLQKKNERKINAVEMQPLHKICGVSLVGRTRNEETEWLVLARISQDL